MTATTTAPKKSTPNSRRQDRINAEAIADVEAATASRETIIAAPAHGELFVPLHLVDVGENVRKSIDQASIEELAASLDSEGLIQPIGVEAAGDRYTLVFGQRRVLAARHLGWEAIAANIVQPHDRDVAQILENVQREDLNAIDLGEAFKRLEARGLGQADIARRLGRSAPYVSNAIRLLGADPKVQAAVVSGELSATHARALLGLPAVDQRAIAKRVVDDHISSHQLEQEIKWKRDAADQAERKARKTEKWIPKAIAALDAASIAKDAGVHVTGSYYDVDVSKISAAVQKAGWKVTTEYGVGINQAGCDCTSIRLSVGGRKAEIERSCHDIKHLDRSRNNDHLARKAEDDQRASLWAEVAGILRPSLEALPVPLLRLLARSAKQGSGWYAPPSSFDDMDGPTAVGEILGALARMSHAIDPAQLLEDLRGEPVAPTDAGLERLGVGILVQDAVERGEAQEGGDPEPAGERPDIARLRSVAPDLCDEGIDPYAVEQAHHGETGVALDGPTRDRVRARTDCERCVALTEVYDTELMGAMINGTGPWAGMGS